MSLGPDSCRKRVRGGVLDVGGFYLVWYVGDGLSLDSGGALEPQAGPALPGRH